MSLEIIRPTGGPDVTRRNKRDILYIKGDENTDGSIRFMFTDGDDFAHIELRTTGVWDDTGLRVSSNSLQIGRDMNISSAGGFLETLSIASPVGHQRAVIPHNEFNENGTQGGHMPILDVINTFIIFSNPVTQILSGTISQLLNFSNSLLLDKAFLLTGTIPASQEIQLSFYVGTDNTGSLFSRTNYPASQFPASSTVILDFKDDFGLETGVDIFMEFVSSESFSLQIDSGGNIILSFSAHEMKEQDIITDNLILTNDLSLVFTNDLDFVVGNNF